MRYALLVAAVLIPTAASAGGAFYGGVADGMQDAQELELQRRAIEVDRLYGTSTYDRMRQQRLMEENNRLLRQLNEQQNSLLPRPRDLLPR